MPADPIDTLLEKLCSGDAEAAERVFLAYQPYLRMVVRRQLPSGLRSKFDSIDVVQSVWADVLQGFREAEWSFEDAAHLRAFLAKVTRNRFIDRVRHHQPAMAREQRLETANPELMPPSALPRASEVAQADELWHQMLALCPPAHHELLRLKRQGFKIAEIATKTGLHGGSVRRILYDLARQMAGERKKTSILSATDDKPSAIRT